MGINAKLEVQGGLVGEVEVLGNFKVTVFDTAKADLVCFKLTAQDRSFKYKVHPNLNKQSHANSILEVRDASKAYRANIQAPLLKWKLTSSNEDLLPVKLSCWPSQTADGTEIVLEYEVISNDVRLDDVHIKFPCPPSGGAAIASADPGEAVYDADNSEVHWRIPQMGSNEGSSGTLEFTALADASSLL